MFYVITSDQGRTVHVAEGEQAASTYIRQLMTLGGSYSVETSKTPPARG
ncbi:hypothetical protein ACIRPK_36700 [Kitasatospora sp. NPDC101801]